MKLIIFAGTPGSGKTSIIKHIIGRFPKETKLFFAKFDCLRTDDEKIITAKYGVPSVKKLAGDICPDHYTALQLPEIIKDNQDKDIILIETAGLCLRCSPYVHEAVGVNILDITAGHPERYGPILTDADIVAVSKGDLISQAEREIFRHNVLQVNRRAEIIEINGLTGEGASDIVNYVKKFKSETNNKLSLRHSMPSAICGYCYGNRDVNKTAVNGRYLAGRDLKVQLPNLNCGHCGLETCNEFIRAVLDDRADKGQCPYIKSK